MFLQEQPPEVFCKKMFFKKFGNIHRKTTVFESEGKDSEKQMFSSEFCKIFMHVNFEEHLQMADSIFSLWKTNTFPKTIAV